MQNRAILGDSAVHYWDRIWQNDDQRQKWTKPHAFVCRMERRLCKAGATRVLDLGAGIGRHSLYLAGKGYRVLALDGRLSGLNTLRQQACQRALPILFQQAGLDDLPLRTECMDAVVCWDTIYHGLGEDVLHRLAEIRRVLKKKGLLVATFLSKENGQYGQGKCIAAHTYVNAGVKDKAHPHFYCSQYELPPLLAGYRILAREHEDYGSYPKAFHWLLTAQKEG